MKKFLSILITVLVLLSFTTTSVLAGSESKKVTLVSVEYREAGIVLIFETSGLSQADLKDRSFYADSDYHPMTCSFVNDTDRVRCVVAKKLAGKGEFMVTLAGFGFWNELPQSNECGEGEVLWYGYNVYVDAELWGGSTVPAWIWENFDAMGGFEEAASVGITYEKTSKFCAPDWDIYAYN